MPDMPHPEIVRVISGCRLLDAHAQEHVYWRRDGRGLAPGYYVARRNTTARWTFNEDAEFRGPYRNRQDAETAMQDLVARTPARRAPAIHAPMSTRIRERAT